MFDEEFSSLLIKFLIVNFLLIDDIVLKRMKKKLYLISKRCEHVKYLLNTIIILIFSDALKRNYNECVK